jgi:hypothetical protein
MNLIQLKTAILVFLVALACFGFLPASRAVNPPPDGGYPVRNTAEGNNALFNLTSGIDNTAVGFNALWGDTTGSQNTGSGSRALASNATGVQNTATGAQALFNNRIGSDNTASGFQALFRNTRGPTTRPLVVQHFLATPPAAGKQPSAFKRSITTGVLLRISQTRPPDFKRWIERHHRVWEHGEWHTGAL